MDQALTLVATQTGDAPVEPYSVAWWESRTAEELRDIINRGFAGGEIFKAANAEIERRDLAAAEAVARRKRKELIWGVGASVLALAVLLGFWLAR